MPASGVKAHRWWKEASIYQIYPASFKDGNCDGWGDLVGIISELDYIASLGVDVIWISPIYPSPQVDMGYDISDYYEIDPRYGRMIDFNDLVDAMKERGLKLMMDLVVNHTSDQHEWFKQARSSKDNPKRDWYIWKPARGFEPDGTPIPPNNWLQLLGEDTSAWTWDEKTEEFYLSLFTPEQPDLNWENLDVRNEVHDVMRFWLRKGASGFRMDVINHISKDQRFLDAPQVLPPPARFQPGDMYFANGPRLHEYLHEIYNRVLCDFDAITVGEMPFVHDDDEILKVVGAKAEELQMIFIFQIVQIDDVPAQSKFSWKPWTPADLARTVSHWQRLMIDKNGWNSVFIENHDQPRSVSRYVDGDAGPEWRARGAKLLALMQTTLSGTLYVYQGEEIGMRNMPREWGIEEYKDTYTLAYWNKVRERFPNDQKRLSHAHDMIAKKARDHARTPVLWTTDPTTNAGFNKVAGVEPWMRAIVEDLPDWSVEAQVGNPDGKDVDGGMTVFYFWQRAIKCRKLHKEVFVYGDYKELADGSDGVFAYERVSEEGDRWITALNFTRDNVMFKIPEGTTVRSWVAGNYGPGKIDKAGEGAVELKPWEGILGMCA